MGSNQVDNQFDADIVNSCVTGLFRVLNDVFKSEEKIGIPFTFTFRPFKSDRNRKKEEEDKNSNKETLKEIIALTVNPKESRLTGMIMSELSMIYEMVQSRHQTDTIMHFVNKYISLSRNLLDNNKIDEFRRITEWYSNHILKSSFEKENQDQIVPLFYGFKEQLAKNYPFATDIFTIHRRNTIIDNRR